MYALHKWLEHRICSWSMEADTRRLLLDNEAPFKQEIYIHYASFVGFQTTISWFSLFDFFTERSVSRELQDCSSLDDLQWIRSMRPISLDVTDSARMQQRKGNVLRLASLERPPFVIFERHSNGTISGFKGYCYEIIHALQKIYNFTYEVDQPKDNTYGTVMPNGSWNGMIGMIKEQVIDIGVGPFSVTYSRFKAVDFTVAFFEEPTGILIPPPAEDNRLLACTKPFRLEVWLSLLLCTTTLPIVLWKDLQIMWKTYQKATTTYNENSKEENHFQEKCPTLAQQYFFVLGVLIGQSGQKLPSLGCSPRLLGAFWCLSAVVFASAYVGILVGFLSIPRLSPIISSLEELPASKLEWGVQRGTALETLFTEATTGVYKTIGDGLLRQPTALVDVNTHGIQRVTNGSYAFIKEKSYLEFAVEEDYARSGSCRLSIAKQEFFKVNFALALPTASPLKTILDKKILQLMETGLGEYWKKIHWPRSNRKCDGVKGSSAPKSLGLADLQGAFLILAIGFGTASLIFVAEGLVKVFR
ncbi:glutamate receptor ionotropic, kainate 3-like [Daphnia carinata]|uniref:glutamate receptor ionotropic, kainate 3-like n=1 Tax=Daphnia carinata TaxID=120202 RepID=UPI00286847DF|nr:glutamate receptor ionotropic, kainate 3-like [Daphnia carinata]